MLRNKLGSLRKELKKINATRDKKIFNAFVCEEKNKAAVELGRKVIFEGSYIEYLDWLKNRGGIIIQDNYLVQWDWGLRGPVMDWDSVKNEITL